MAEVAMSKEIFAEILDYPESVDYDPVQTNELLSNKIRWKGISDR
jgi:hypothetical protein